MVVQIFDDLIGHSGLDKIGLPRLLQRENLFQVGRFREEARTFFRNSNLDLKDEPPDRLLKNAAELDDTPGMVRPITMNALGFVLRQRGGAMASVDAGQLCADTLRRLSKTRQSMRGRPHCSRVS
jgi:hypothetical protein